MGSHRGRVARQVAAVGVGATAAFGATAFAAAILLARGLLTPDGEMVDDVEILSADDYEVVLRRTPTTLSPGRYGLWFARGSGHARLGGVVTDDARGRTVTRALLGVDHGSLSPGPGSWDPYFFAASPEQSLALPTEHLSVPSDVGPLPSWVVPGAAGTAARDTWAVLVHGRGACREEALRAIPTLHRLGLTCIVLMYRNDVGAPPGAGGRYALGLSEWRDVEAAMHVALERGARRVVLVGWSMGGAIVLQLLDRSPLAHLVAAVVLNGPVIDWGEVVRFHLRRYYTPWPVMVTAAAMMRHPRHGRWILGMHQPIDLAHTDWVARSSELDHRMLIVHSSADEVVPNKASRALAARRPDLVTFVDDGVASHGQEWNVDPQRWDGLVADFLGRALAEPPGEVSAPTGS